MAGFSFATFLIVCPTSFFLGMAFCLLPYDYPVLWSSIPTPSSHYDQVEAHLKLLYNSPPLVERILHIIIFLGLIGLVWKLYKPSESNYLFDGGSLVLYMCGVVVYIANIIKGLRIVDDGTYGEGLNSPAAEEADMGGYTPEGNDVLGREDNLKVLAASNTILALVLVGVLVLQAGQWYAERADESEQRKIREKESLQGKPVSEGGAGQGPARKGSNKESKKVK
ncbi:putative secretory component protein shr3 [Phaeomoniella chlamydospora]|uniref:Putative secretory component protein shr3 n=1 Tax=Phaeomoniella chlamydospora TaxID=158046 RepID=A0A0G2G295_PHACM|nr:putative secretory component protein shr3 [Phaeomoniella chlamydospora]